MIRLLAPITQAVDLTAVMEKVDTAQATANNARQMVLTRDPRLSAVETQQASLEQLAATLGAAIPASETTHAGFNTRIKALEDAVTALTGRAVTAQSKRATTTQLLALGASIDLTVTWDRAFPDTNYVVIPLLDASTGIANVQGPAYKNHTAAGATVTIKANVAVAAGVAVNVVGLRLG